MTDFNLNPGQTEALHKVVEFLGKGRKPGMFLIKGAAGTGKTYLTKAIRQSVRGKFVYTAPTNKASRVLKQNLTTPEYKPECRTICSLLGLQMSAEGEFKELKKPEEEVDLSTYSAVFLDEGSMANRQLKEYIDSASAMYNLPFIVLMDKYQLPPVGEARSALEDIEDQHELLEQMRFGGPIMEQAGWVRDKVFHPFPTYKPKTDFSEGKGVWVETGQVWNWRMREVAEEGLFSHADQAKAIAWTNARVGELNRQIRDAIFPGVSEPWVVGDRITLLRPAKSLSDGTMRASTDEEGTVQAVVKCRHPVFEEFSCWAVTMIADDNQPITLHAIHEGWAQRFEQHKKDLANEARIAPSKWKDYWAFCDSFHSIRHGYATTAHRSQGSTYSTAFVDYRDILRNQNRREAFQCLYVANTRPKNQLILA